MSDQTANNPYVKQKNLINQKNEKVTEELKRCKDEAVTIQLQRKALRRLHKSDPVKMSSSELLLRDKPLAERIEVLKKEVARIQSEGNKLDGIYVQAGKNFKQWEKEVRAPLKATLQAKAEQKLAELAEIRQERAELKEKADKYQQEMNKHQQAITQHYDNIDTIVRGALGVNEQESNAWMKSKQSDTIPPKYRGQISSQAKTKDPKQPSTRLFSSKPTKHSLGAKHIDGDNSSGYGSGASSGGDSASSSPKGAGVVPAYSN